MNMNYLTWDIKINSSCLDDDNKVLVPTVIVEPIIDGITVHTNWSFDWISMSLLNLKSSLNNDVYMFTCSCGEPGCAGIFSPVKLKIKKDIVSWIVPDEKPYQSFEELGWKSENNKLIWCFDKKQYLESFDILISRLCDLEKEIGKFTTSETSYLLSYEWDNYPDFYSRYQNIRNNYLNHCYEQ